MVRAREKKSPLFGDTEWDFWGEATGLRGIYEAAASLRFKVPANITDVGGIGWPRNHESARQAISNFVSQLGREGWESIGISGAYWYQYKFRRRVK